MDYKNAGVDIEAGKIAVNSISDIVKSTFRDEVVDNFGSFGSLFSLSNLILKYKEPILVSGTDGVGTKLKIAFDANKHDTIGLDLVAMSVNDIACLGAEPLFFLDYISTSKLNPAAIKEIIIGIAEGCKIAGCSLIGGEMAEMPSFYKNNEYDLAGFAVGIVDKNSVINGLNIKEGDSIVGIASSGLHSNGYSLARKIVFDLMSLSIDDKFLSDGTTLADALLEPTIIYSGLVGKLVEKFEGRLNIKGIAHITGGGIPENLKRIVPEGVIAEIDKNSWQQPEIFNILKENGKIEEAEFYKVFNCGIGMIIVVNKDFEVQVINFINNFNKLNFTDNRNKKSYKSFKIGNIVKSDYMETGIKVKFI
jgi:phosphoribosylformylglycinamidine cyclo-ligase